MNYWDILQIEPTSDQTAIRRAYAKILKTIDQESHPEQFIQLREAYTWAIHYGSVYLEDEEDEDDTPDHTKQSVMQHSNATSEDFDSTEPADSFNTDQVTLITEAEHICDLLLSGSSLNGLGVRLHTLLQHLNEQELATQMIVRDILEYGLAFCQQDIQPLLDIWQKNSGLTQPTWQDHPAKHRLYQRITALNAQKNRHNPVALSDFNGGGYHPELPKWYSATLPNPHDQQSKPRASAASKTQPTRSQSASQVATNGSKQFYKRVMLSMLIFALLICVIELMMRGYERMRWIDLQQQNSLREAAKRQQ